MKRVSNVEEYLSKHDDWKDVLSELRSIMLDTEMEETIKWGAPTYTVNGKNVIGLGAFKNYVGLWFFQGSFLKDEKKMLVNAQEGKTKALRQWRFASVAELKEHRDLVKAYVLEAIENQKAGKEIKPKTKKMVMPDNLKSALKQDPELNAKFGDFTPGRQREFADYINEAKREATKDSRLEKIIPMIKSGKGLNDKYR